MNAYMHTYIHAYIHAYIHTCMHAYIHTSSCAFDLCRTSVMPEEQEGAVRSTPSVVRCMMLPVAPPDKSCHRTLPSTRLK